ncbi:MAG: hypothetical protein L0H31_10315, partial [Nocardioidaceae bacterium]|nr:hypothetical protein [Nocardioidaceae bacterium]
GQALPIKLKYTQNKSGSNSYLMPYPLDGEEYERAAQWATNKPNLFTDEREKREFGPYTPEGMTGFQQQAPAAQAAPAPAPAGAPAPAPAPAPQAAAPAPAPAPAPEPAAAPAAAPAPAPAADEDLPF